MKVYFQRTIQTILILSAITCSVNALAANLGVVSDLHGDYQAAEKLIDSMNVKSVLLLGDFPGFSKDDPDYREYTRNDATPSEKRAAFNRLKSRAGTELSAFVERLNSRGIVPMAATGNHDRYVAEALDELNSERKIRLLTTSADKGTITTIEGKRVMVSHYPQFKIPYQYMPEGALEMDAVLAGKMSSFGYPSEAVDLVVFGHTHMPVHYVDPKISATILNPGAVTTHHMATGEPSGVVYNLESGEANLHRLNVASGRVSVGHFEKKGEIARPSARSEAENGPAKGGASGCDARVAGALLNH
jgi:predicted phosphodiesterase